MGKGSSSSSSTTNTTEVISTSLNAQGLQNSDVHSGVASDSFNDSNVSINIMETDHGAVQAGVDASNNAYLTSRDIVVSNNNTSMHISDNAKDTAHDAMRLSYYTNVTNTGHSQEIFKKAVESQEKINREAMEGMKQSIRSMNDTAYTAMGTVEDISNNSIRSMGDLSHKAINENTELNRYSFQVYGDLYHKALNELSLNSEKANKYAHDVALESMEFADNLTRDEDARIADKSITTIAWLGFGFYAIKAIEALN